MKQSAVHHDQFKSVKICDKCETTHSTKAMSIECGRAELCARYAELVYRLRTIISWSAHVQYDERFALSEERSKNLRWLICWRKPRTSSRRYKGRIYQLMRESCWVTNCHIRPKALIHQYALATAFIFKVSRAHLQKPRIDVNVGRLKHSRRLLKTLSTKPPRFPLLIVGSFTCIKLL